MRLVRSSVPGAVERDAALRLIAERAVLTRMVCTELQNQDDFSSASRRSSMALGFLLGWIADTFPNAVRVKPRATDGLSEMVVPDACEPVMEEIGAGAEVAEAYAMLLTADNSIQAAGDIAILRERLESYWTRHASPCALPWF